ncbi:MAG TPA: EAL domain-containing protein, partial [Nitrospiria bacterium]|nr:EAL domain-containing protein [Nitrospiria bacterium]
TSTMDPGEVCELHRKNSYDLILLDLLMPGMDGFQVMEGLKEIELDGYLPVLVITVEPGHKLRALKGGAKDFISKPFELAEVLARVHNMLEVRLLHKELHNYNDVLEKRVRERTADLQESHLETIFTIEKSKKALIESELKFRSLVESASEAIILANSSGEIIFWNKGAQMIFGYTEGEIMGKPLVVLLPERYRDGHQKSLKRLQETGDSRLKGKTVEMEGLRKEGEEFSLEISMATWKTEKERFYSGIIRDITVRKKAEEELKDSQERNQLLLNSTAEAIYGLDMDGRCTFCNQSSLRILGYARADDLIGKNMHLLIHHTKPDGTPFPETECKIYRAFRNGKGVHVSDEVLWRADGSSFPAEYWSYPIFKNGILIGSVMSFLDITNRKQAEYLVHHMAYYDILTGFPNRHFFHDLLEKAISQSQQKGRSVAILLLDLDRFKEINDTLGHHRGDLLLKNVGIRLKEAVFTTDTVARLGGDEFGILLSMASSDDARLVANKILKVLEEPFEVEGLPVVVETSIGIALYPDHGSNADTLIQRGDVAMYASKKGKIGFVLYNSELDQYSPRRLALMGELRHAIENQQLFLHYQPIIDLRTRRICGVESLVRWNHPKHGIIPPVQFILPAEQTGLIKPLTKFVLQEAIQQCLAWARYGKNISMAVNLSVRNLQDPLLISQMIPMIHSHGIEPSLLNFEITETAIMTNVESVVKTISLLNHEGVNFSIDDFGIGYTSLSYLKKLAVKSIKIDQSFIKTMLTNQEDHLIVRSTIDLAHSLNLRVIAEGVEDQETLEKLIAIGCDEAQGYFICRPIPAEDLLRWTNESPWGLA